MSEGSHAYLFAARVRDACSRTLHDIRRARSELLASLSAQYRHRVWFLPDRTHREAMSLLTPEERGIAEWHRAEEETLVKNLRSLADAAMMNDADFRVFVSASDFEYIRKWYGKHE